ncbi:MAG: hypothetical protein ACLP8S_10990, partial [Solirubrobacteraceae bacterium]
RATDLHMKLEWLRERYGRRVVTMATATPIANSVTEAQVTQRYLRPDLLRTAGVEHFDQWAATFGQTVTEIEMAPTGGGNYRMNTRFAHFLEMLRMWHVFADVKTARTSLKLPVPALRPTSTSTAMRNTPQGPVVIPAGQEIADYLHELASPHRRGPCPRGTAGGGQHAQDLKRRPQSGARHAARLRLTHPADIEQREGRILRQGNQNPRSTFTGKSSSAASAPTAGRPSSAKQSVAAQASFQYEG